MDSSEKRGVPEEKSVRIPVSDELYEVAREAAQKAGVSTEEFLRNLLREKLRDVPAPLEIPYKNLPRHFCCETLQKPANTNTKIEIKIIISPPRQKICSEVPNPYKILKESDDSHEAETTEIATGTKVCLNDGDEIEIPLGREGIIGNECVVDNPALDEERLHQISSLKPGRYRRSGIRLVVVELYLGE